MHFRKLTHRISPFWLHSRLFGDWNEVGLKKYFKNTSWIFFAKLFSYIVSFITVAIVARYLGPENYGRLSYSQSFVAIFSVFASLGIDQILYRELINDPKNKNVWLGTAFITKFTFGLITLTATIIAALLLNGEDTLLTWMIAIISFSFIFQPFSVIGHYFNSLVQSKYVAGATISVALLIPILKLIIVFSNKGILYFAALLMVESAIFALFYIYIYFTVFKQTLFEWNFSFSILKRLLSESWPLLLASLSGYVYGRIDQVMIQYFIDSTAVGLYDAAVRLTEILGFLPSVIIGSLFPALINAKKQNPDEYKRRFRKMAILCISISLIAVVSLYALSPLIVGLLFGSDFIQTISILKIYVWSNIGTVSIILIQNYFIAEERSKTFFLFSMSGAIINIVLNIILIPLYGIYGAAYATLATFIFIIVVFFLKFK